MATQAAILDHIRATNDRLNRALDRRVAREYLAFADEAEQAEQERRDRARRHADRCSEHQRRYDEAFGLFGKKAPEPAADAFPPTYRRDLFRHGQRMLPDGHELTDFDPEELSSSTIIPFEERLLDALKNEAERPSGSNLPKDGSIIERTRTDSRSGAREVRFFGRHSFIRSMGHPAKRAFFYAPGTVLSRRSVGDIFAGR
jgi:hypothetical protein